MNEIVSYNNIETVEQLKGALNAELNKAAVSFVRIGYLLKTARDTEILKDSEYSDVNEFASKEFGLDKSQVSRFIRINDRFSIGGYSEHLKVEYEEYGSAKLSIMLTLPDEINEELSPEMSKADIQIIKDEYDEEQKVSDIEVMLEKKEEQPETGEGMDEFLTLVVKQLNDEHPDPINRFHIRDLPFPMDDLQDAYMPDGDRVYNIRISGQGRFMVSMKKDGITITNMRDPANKSRVSWDEFMKYVVQDEEKRSFPEQDREEKPEKKEQKPKKVERSAASKSNSAMKNTEVVKNVERIKPEETEIVETKNDDSLNKNADPEVIDTETEKDEPAGSPTIHRLKTLPEYFGPAKDFKKQFELRKDDRDYKVGDLVTLEEWDGTNYTGAELRNRTIKYILRNCPELGLQDGYCILGF